MEGMRGSRRGVYYSRVSPVRYRKKVTDPSGGTSGGNGHYVRKEQEIVSNNDLKDAEKVASGVNGGQQQTTKDAAEGVGNEKKEEMIGEEERKRKMERDEWRRKEREKNLKVVRRSGCDVGQDVGGGTMSEVSIGVDGEIEDSAGLDSSFKKCNAFIRKLKGGITSDNIDTLIAECQGLNLARYVSEMVAGILDGKLKTSEIDAVIKLSGLLHRRYVQFAGMLVPGLIKGAVGEGAGGSGIDKGIGVGVRKASLKILGDLVVVGITQDMSPIFTCLKKLIGGKRLEETRADVITDISVVGSWLKAASEAFLPDGGKGWETQVVSLKDKNTLGKWVESWYESTVIPEAEKCYAELKEAEAANIHANQTKGVVGEELLAEYERVRKRYERIETATLVIAEVLGREYQQRKIGNGDELSQAANEEEELGDIWEDEEEEQFYNKLPVLPGSKQAREVLRNASARAIEKEPEQEVVKVPEHPKVQQHETKSIPPEHVRDGRSKSTKKATVYRKKKTSVSDFGRRPSVGRAGLSSTTKDEGRGALTLSKSESSTSAKDPLVGIIPEPYTPTPSLDSLLSRLGSTDTLLECDRFVASFCVVAQTNRSSQKRLIKSLFTVSPLKVSVLPFYARIAASLNPVYPEVPQTVVQQLSEEFINLLSQKTPDEVLLQKRVKNARFIGELTKFKIIAPYVVFEMLDTCIDNFSSFTVDVICHLLETCGRFLYRTPTTHVRMNNILGILWRLKSVKNLEAKHNALIETVYFSIKPPISKRSLERSPKSPLHEFIRRLLYRTLSPHNPNQIVRTLSKLPWSNKDIQDFVVERIVAVEEMRFNTLDAMAKVVLGLTRIHEAIGIAVVDRLLESIRQGIERDDAREAQHRIAELALLSSLHITGLIPSTVIFEVLYDLVDAGYTSAGWFTVRAICVILERCGAYWKNGRASGTGQFMRHTQRKKIFWAIFEKSVFDKKEREASLSNGSALGQNLSGNLKADQNKIAGTTANTYPVFDGVESIVRNSSSGKPSRQEIGVIPLGIQHVLAEAWEAIRDPGLEKAGNYESALKVVAQILEREDQRYMCWPQRSVEPKKTPGGMSPSPRIEEEEDEDDGDADEDEDVEDADLTQGSSDSGASDAEERQSSDSDEDDDNLILSTPAKKAKMEEQTEFERELVAFTAESVSTARSAAAFSSQNLSRMAIPIGLLAKHAIAADPLQDDMDREDTPSVVPFQMLVRRGTKSTVKELDVPVGSTIAAAARESEVVGEAENAEVRRLVLESRTVLEEDEEIAGTYERKERDEREILAALFKP